MRGILGQHPAGQIGNQTRHAGVAKQGGQAAEFQFAQQNGSFVHSCHRGLAARQCQHDGAEGVDIVRDNPVAAPGWQALGHVGWLEHRGLQRGGRPGPGRAQDDRCAGACLEDVVGADGAVGLAERFQLREGERGGADQAGQQFRFPPRARISRQRWPRRGGADDVVSIPGSTVAAWGQHPGEFQVQQAVQSIGTGRVIGLHAQGHEWRCLQARVHAGECG